MVRWLPFRMKAENMGLGRSAAIWNQLLSRMTARLGVSFDARNFWVVNLAGAGTVENFMEVMTPRLPLPPPRHAQTRSG